MSTPEYSTIIIARKPCEGSCIDNVLKYGVGGINIDDCRVGTDEITTCGGNKFPNLYGDYNECEESQHIGRFPANVILTYAEETKDEVIGGMPNAGSGNGGTPYSYAGKEYNNKDTSMFNGDKPQSPSNYNDNGSAARYFYNAQYTERDQEYIKYEVRPMEDQEVQQNIHLYSEGKNYKLYQGSMIELLDIITPNSIDAVVTDPPYELGFMNKGWDRSGIAFQIETWEKCYQALKPGGYLIAFGGSRTHHRITCAIEDAGFEIRDCIMWLFGAGFPKSMNIAKGIEAKEQYGKAGTSYKRMIEQSGDGEEYTVMQTNNGAMGDEYEATRKEYIPTSENAKKWDGWGTTLKPAYEAIILARKPCEGSCIENVLQHGVGGINIDECRISFQDDNDYSITANKNQHEKFGTKPMTNNNVYGDYSMVQPKNYVSDGRFPSNVMLSYDDETMDEVIGGMPITTSSGGSGVASHGGLGKRVYGEYADTSNISNLGGLGDTGSAARYFYTAKASKRDRDEGLIGFTPQIAGGMDASVRKVNPLGSASLKGQSKPVVPKCNVHPCVKPTDLMQYLVRLVTPKGGIVLDPFNGSGSTGKAVMYENKDRKADYTYIGIELNEEYLAISDARIKYAATVNESLTKPTETKQKIANNQMNLFDIPN